MVHHLNSMDHIKKQLKQQNEHVINHYQVCLTFGGCADILRLE